ncbi:hypothetical protein B0H17DRAFT_1147809 [Mycena rosella]|uniref:Uncharacterized protein n=1 Tax=Mycena rosella TaxID=1033263 RepID=A0AAD7CHF2_MYCRO|nr:hypothetical protein B0H17DRAFT_1147809 [Mycena rosella]
MYEGGAKIQIGGRKEAPTRADGIGKNSAPLFHLSISLVSALHCHFLAGWAFPASIQPTTFLRSSRTVTYRLPLSASRKYLSAFRAGLPQFFKSPTPTTLQKWRPPARLHQQTPPTSSILRPTPALSPLPSDFTNSEKLTPLCSDVSPGLDLSLPFISDNLGSGDTSFLATLDELHPLHPLNLSMPNMQWLEEEAGVGENDMSVSSPDGDGSNPDTKPEAFGAHHLCAQAAAFAAANIRLIHQYQKQYSLHANPGSQQAARPPGKGEKEKAQGAQGEDSDDGPLATSCKRPSAASDNEQPPKRFKMEASHATSVQRNKPAQPIPVEFDEDLSPLSPPPAVPRACPANSGKPANRGSAAAADGLRPPTRQLYVEMPPAPAAPRRILVGLSTSAVTGPSLTVTRPREQGPLKERHLGVLMVPTTYIAYHMG